MVKWRAHIAFFTIMTLYFLIRVLRFKYPELPDFIRFHLTDFLFVPAMCLFALIVVRALRSDPDITIPWVSVAIQVVLVTVYFEWYLPNNPPVGHIHIADWLDCAMYILGGISFILLQPLLRQSLKKEIPSNSTNEAARS